MSDEQDIARGLLSKNLCSPFGDIPASHLPHRKANDTGYIDIVKHRTKGARPWFCAFSYYFLLLVK